VKRAEMTKPGEKKDQGIEGDKGWPNGDDLRNSGPRRTPNRPNEFIERRDDGRVRDRDQGGQFIEKQNRNPGDPYPTKKDDEKK